MYQPRFPLKISELTGPYVSIKKIQDTVKQNVVTLLNVSPGEWPGKPELGIGLKRFLFSNYPSPEFDTLSQRITDQFAKYFPFLSVKSSFITEDSYGNSLIDTNTIKLVVEYSIDSLNLRDSVVLDVSEKAS